MPSVSWAKKEKWLRHFPEKYIKGGQVATRLDRPHQTEWLAGRIGVDAPVRAGAVQSGGTDVEGGPFRRVHVLDGHVEADLLRVRRIPPPPPGVLLPPPEHHPP